jgi:hypothetical protein
MQTRTLVLIAVVVVVLLLLAYWYWRTYDHAKLVIASSGVTVGSKGALTFAFTTTSKSVPATWTGKKIVVYTSSLGAILTTVGTASSGSLTTAAGAYTGSATYTYNDSDYAVVTLAW